MSISSIHEEPGTIFRLPDNVINLIAAGEVIQRPANAVKELIENSLDAKATDIRITVKNGGLKYLQVQDNGIGIRSTDLELLCHRYTTSKLRQFDDLKSISTYGFRGEALASISQVSHLTIVTKLSSAIYGYQAQYEGGRLKEKPKPCACNKGTQITVEDLFYNMEDRRQALKSAGEEMKKIADVVEKYAIHNAHVAFTLKKQGETMLDLRTPGGNHNDTSSSCLIRSAIGLVYGLPLSRELLHFRCEDVPSSLSFSAEGYVSNPGYSTKKYSFILFINNRLVECQALKNTVETLYTAYGPIKSVTPFVYVKLEIAPENMDVNVHPNKRQVQFLHETEILGILESAIKKTLDTCNVSKTFLVKTFPTSSTNLTNLVSNDKDQPNENSESSGRQREAGNSQKKPAPQTVVRTDGKERKLDEFMDSQRSSQSQNIRVNFVAINEVAGGSDLAAQIVQSSSSAVETGSSSHLTDEEAKVLYEEETRQPRWRPINLASVMKLQKAVTERSSASLRSLIANHTFVGCLDEQYALVQFKTGLHLVNTTALNEEFFYQLMLFQFGNFGALMLSEKCRLVDLICLGMTQTSDESNTDKRSRVYSYANLLQSKSEMLWDYFSLQLVDGYLTGIPWLLDKYIPQLEGLPIYMYRLATAVDWDEEEKCFETFCRETSKFYAFKKFNLFNDPENIGDWKLMMETVLYPAMKSKLIMPERFNDSRVIMKLTDVHDLYRVFERC